MNDTTVAFDAFCDKNDDAKETSPMKNGCRPSFNSVAYLGAYEPDYARHRIIQSGLVEKGIQIRESTDRSRLPSSWRNLMMSARQVGPNVPIIVGESSNFLTPVLMDMKRAKRPVVFDTFVSIRDTYEDRHTGIRRRFTPIMGEVIDRCNNWASSAVLLDTHETKKYFIEDLGLDPAKAFVVYVGAETLLFRPRSTTPKNRPIKVLFYGTFIPLHGIDIIVNAAAEVQKHRDDIHFQVIGDGQTRRDTERLVQQLDLGNTTLGPKQVSFTELPGIIADADICLGVFADRPKTMRVIPNKLFQCMAVGVPVITADTPGVREGFTADEVEMVPPGNSLELANAILKLADDQNRRTRLGLAGAKAVRERFSPSAIADQVIAACEYALR